jgi:hypothetical protein
MTATTPAYPDLPDPAGALLVDPDWQDSGTNFYRPFHGTSWVVELPDSHVDASVKIAGFQYSGGQVECWIHVDNAEGLFPAQARQLARALIAAADEVEKMTGYDKITTDS